ncbi:cytochrome c maturation protein CcmE [Chelatococcus asaccharovorans]|uniref:cytochrome c maturation protein CcmE n=1 Tax=Chelatococcus asaccharovorans TaxID=28210 RepID=UPI00224C6B66|nr:cytochrome c maturation protein CcmE [Chelatococcus asaccharovorans]CAH1671295.1 periplasmic heme chaperone [Chelatococcus asaccharovorans]CAH1677274.1 periplasmic heme chaperone [Chelatococcus asaccharovorans]
MTRKQRRLTLIAAGGAVIAVALALVLTAMRDTIVFFRAPSDIVTMDIKPGTRLRLGGLVAEGSIVREPGQRVVFVVKDANHAITVNYTGMLPDLFREGQGVVAEGVLGPDRRFTADNVLAKHDERYMPREVADTLKKQGLWQHTGDADPAGATQ